MTSILIIEDSPTEAHVFQRTLEKHGYSVEVAANGEEGIERAVITTPDLILMDVVMPGVNGFQATRELRRYQETASIPVIMVTTKAQETDKIWGLRQGACDYLIKPVKESVLLGSVHQAIQPEAMV